MATANSTPSASFSGPTQASRVRGFATFFKSYMSVWSLVVAALPIPIGYFKLVPTFEAQRSYLSVYTSLFCFLSLGFIFFQRHHLGAYMFKRPGLLNVLLLRQGPMSPSRIASQMVSSGLRAFVTWLPLGCILLTVFAVFHYHDLFNDAVLIAQAEEVAEKQQGTLGVAFLADIAHSDRLSQKVLATDVLRENTRILIAPGATESAGLPSDIGKELAGSAVSDEAKDVAIEYQTSNKGISEKSKHYFVGMDADKYLKLSENVPASVAFWQARKFLGGGVNVPSADEVLKTKTIPLSSDLMLWLIIFVAAENAFILMALKEYLQDLAHISDLTLMGMEGAHSTQPSSPSPS